VKIGVALLILALLLVACQPKTVIVEVTPDPGKTPDPIPLMPGLTILHSGWPKIYRFEDREERVMCWVVSMNGVGIHCLREME
jgi:hypothetical protein